MVEWEWDSGGVGMGWWSGNGIVVEWEWDGEMGMGILGWINSEQMQHAT